MLLYDEYKSIYRHIGDINTYSLINFCYKSIDFKSNFLDRIKFLGHISKFSNTKINSFEVQLNRCN